MSTSTISGGIFSYDRIRCNAHGCNTQIYRHLLCRAHWDRYATTEGRIDLLANIEEANFGTPSAALKKFIRSNHRRHNFTGMPLPFVEHFPLETLFHQCRREIVSYNDLSPQDAIVAVAKRVKELIEDFGWGRNEWLAELRVDYAQLTGDFSTLYHADISISRRIADFFKRSPIRMWLYATAVVCFLILVGYSPHLSKLGFFVPADLTTESLIALYLSYVGVVVFGLFALQRVDSVGETVSKHRLYEDAQASQRAVLVFAKIRARFDARSDLDHVVMGNCTAAAFAVAASLSWGHWSWSWQTLAVVVQQLALVPCLYAAFMIYCVYANASTALSELPLSKFLVKPDHADKRYGVADVADLIFFILTFNISFLLFISFIAPIMFTTNVFALCFWFVLISPIVHFRLMHIRHSWNLRRALLASVDDAIPNKRARFLTLLLSAQAKKLEFVVATILIPLLMLLGDKYFKDFIAWLEVILR